MKNLNVIMIALACLAVPFAASGQNVTCEDCTHYLSVYGSNGGFIAEHDDNGDNDKVVWVSTCNGVTVSGELTPNEDGMVSAVFNDANGLGCDTMNEKNEFQLGPVTDSGWFWITGEESSAVGNIVAKGILGNENTIEPVNAGDSVETTSGKGAAFLEHSGSGRIGILPTILPMPDMEPVEAVKCSYTTRGTGASAVHTRQTSDCMLGDGKGMLRVQGPPDRYTGKPAKIADKGSVVRPAVGSVEVTVDLWGNGTGHFTTDEAGDARIGHAETPIAMAETGLTANMAANVGAGTPIGAVGSEVAGMSWAVAASVGTLTIGPDTDYCSTTANHRASVTFSAALDETERAVVTPTLTGTPAPTDGLLTVATQTISVVCPSGASANMGTDLVPENPFPVD